MDRLHFVEDRIVYVKDRLFYAETVYSQVMTVYFQSGPNTFKDRLLNYLIILYNL